jgi:hypothetical protein
VPLSAVSVDPEIEQSPEMTVKLTTPVPLPPEEPRVAVSPKVTVEELVVAVNADCASREMVTVTVLDEVAD